MVARHVGALPGDGVRKVRAPQRRVAGNTRPPRGEDQCHSDDAESGASRDRSETRQTLPGARPSRRAQPGSPGERCAAQPSGRSHEPSGNRRPQMDGHRRAPVRESGTELGLQTASLTHSCPRCGCSSVICHSASSLALNAPDEANGSGHAALDSQLSELVGQNRCPQPAGAVMPTPSTLCLCPEDA